MKSIFLKLCANLTKLCQKNFTEDESESNHQSPTDESPQYEMIVEPANENDEESETKLKIVKCASLANKQQQIPASRVIKVNAVRK